MSLSKESQLATAVLMVRPARFQSNPQTAASNRFQGNLEVSPAEQQAAALREFENLASALEARGVRVLVFNDTPEPHTPDAIFPNNWVSFHADGTVVLYPMEAENRRTERRHDVVEALAGEHGFLVREVVDLTSHEAKGHYLEGTGSLVLDRVNRIAYACLSSRTQLDPLGDFAQRLDYEVVSFDAVDAVADLARMALHQCLQVAFAGRLAQPGQVLVDVAGAIDDYVDFIPGKIPAV